MDKDNADFDGTFVLTGQSSSSSDIKVEDEKNANENERAATGGKHKVHKAANTKGRKNRKKEEHYAQQGARMNDWG